MSNNPLHPLPASSDNALNPFNELVSGAGHAGVGQRSNPYPEPPPTSLSNIPPSLPTLPPLQPQPRPGIQQPQPRPGVPQPFNAAPALQAPMRPSAVPSELDGLLSAENLAIPGRAPPRPTPRPAPSAANPQGYSEKASAADARQRAKPLPNSPMAQPTGKPARRIRAKGELKPMRFTIVPCPSPALAKTNMIIVSPRDFDASMEYIIMNDQFVFTIKCVSALHRLASLSLERKCRDCLMERLDRSDQAMGKGMLGCSVMHRRWAYLSENQEVLVEPFEPSWDGPNTYLGSLDLEVQRMLRAGSLRSMDVL